jgi:hypothetical protein
MPFGQNVGVGQSALGQMQGGQMGQQPPNALGNMPMQSAAQQAGQMQGGMTMRTNPNMGGQIAPMQVGQQVAGSMMGGGMGSTPSFANKQDYDNFMAQGGMQGVQDRMAGIGALGGGMYPGGGFNRYPPQIDPNTGYPVGAQIGLAPRIGTQGPGDMPPLGRDRPTKGPIDGRKLRDMMDITRRREMDFDLKNRLGGGLPGSARDGTSPSLNRPSRPTK